MMKKYRESPLKAHIKQVRGIAFNPNNVSDSFFEGAIPLLKANNITEHGLDESNLIFIHKNNVRKEQFILPGDILLAASSGSKKSIGKNIYLPQGFPGSFGAFCKIVRPLTSLNSAYLSHFFKTPYYKNNIESSVQGANINNLRNEHLDQLLIPLPPLDDQKRIAFLLCKVESLISQRKGHLQYLDILLKSIFVEMFLAENEPRIKRLDGIADVTSGVTKGKKYAGISLVEVPYVRVANVQDGYLDLSEIKTILVTRDEAKKYALKYGDLLLTEGGDPDKLGRGTIWRDEVDNAIHQNHIFKVRLKNTLEVNPYYLSALMGSAYGKRYFFKSAKQTTGIASINSTQLKSFPAIIPLIDLQNQFAAIVEKVERIKSSYQNSLTELENLYGVLSQKAFKGELDLSRVPLPEDDPTQIAEQDEETPEQLGVAITTYRDIFTYPNDCEDNGYMEPILDDELVFSVIASCNQPFTFEDAIETLQSQHKITPEVLESFAKKIQTLLQQGKLKQEFSATQGKAIQLRVQP